MLLYGVQQKAAQPRHYVFAQSEVPRAARAAGNLAQRLQVRVQETNAYDLRLDLLRARLRDGSISHGPLHIHRSRHAGTERRRARPLEWVMGKPEGGSD